MDGAQRARGDVIEPRNDFGDGLEGWSDATGVNALKDSKLAIYFIDSSDGLT